MEENKLPWDSGELADSLHSQSEVRKSEEEKDFYYPEGPKDFILNLGQQATLDWLVPFCTRDSVHPAGKFRWVLLEGWAGTGKTFTLNRVVEAVRKIDRNIVFGMTAPTHKAVRQLKKHSELKDQLEFGTIHSFLGLVEKINALTGKVTYELDWESKKERKIDSVDVLITDESSMLRDDLFNHMDDTLRNRRDIIIIFTGDGQQIPPVRDDEDRKNGTNINAIPFVEAQRSSRKIAHLQLTDIIRQGAGNPIIEYSARIRENIKQPKVPVETTLLEDGTGIQLLPRKLEGEDGLRAVFLRYFDTPEFQQDPDYVKVIAYTNDTVDYFNKEIRLLINKAEVLPRIIAGEKLIMDKPLLKKDKVILSNNEELDVIEVELSSLEITYKYIAPGQSGFKKIADDAGPKIEDRTLKVETYFARCVTQDDRVFLLHIIHENSVAEFDKAKDSLKSAALKNFDRFDKSAMWREFYKLDSYFGWVKYNYAITAHKSQGSTYQYCISMEWDIERVRDFEERNRIRYVAGTRASKKLYIVK